MRDLIGARVELGVCEMAVLENERDILRRALDLFLEQLVNALAFRTVDVVYVELDQLLAVFVVAHDFAVVDSAIPDLTGTVQQGPEFLCQAIDIFSAEKAGIVVKLATNRVLR